MTQEWLKKIIYFLQLKVKIMMEVNLYLML